MKRNYDNIAFIYDRLAGLVFGNALVQAEEFLAAAVPPLSQIVIAGGGTGRLLENICRKHSSGLTITYIDISANMLARARQRFMGTNTVYFVQADIKYVQLPAMADVVITSFFMDNFSNPTTSLVFNKLQTLLKAGSIWLFADFSMTEKPPLWQKALLKIMYTFFKLTCNIEAICLPDIPLLFAENNFEPVCRQTFFNSFVTAAVYKMR